MKHHSLMVVLGLLSTLVMYACGAPFTADPFAESGFAGGAGSSGSPALPGAGSAGELPSAAGSGGSGGLQVTAGAGGSSGAISVAGTSGAGLGGSSEMAGCAGQTNLPIDQRQCIERVECGKYAPFAGEELCKAAAARMTTQNCPPSKNWVQNECTKMTVDFIGQMDCSSFAGCIP